MLLRATLLFSTVSKADTPRAGQDKPSTSRRLELWKLQTLELFFMSMLPCALSNTPGTSISICIDATTLVANTSAAISSCQFKVKDYCRNAGC